MLLNARRILIFNSSKLCGAELYAKDFTYSHTKKLGTVRSRELGANSTGPLLPIQLSPNLLEIEFLAIKEKWGGCSILLKIDFIPITI